MNKNDIDGCRDEEPKTYRGGYREGGYYSKLVWKAEESAFRRRDRFVLNGVLWTCLSYDAEDGEECFSVVESEPLVDELIDVDIPFEVLGIPIRRIERGVLPKRMKTLHVSSAVVFIGDDINSFADLKVVTVDPGNECYKVVDGRLTPILDGGGTHYRTRRSQV